MYENSLAFQPADRLVTRPRLRSAADLLFGAIVLFFVLFVVWAALTKLDRTVRAQGKVIPSARLQEVSNLEGGIIRKIFVNTGDVVKAGAPLVELDSTQVGADLGAGEATVDALQIKIARLQAEVDGRVPQYPAPRNNDERQQVAIEQSLHASRMADLASIMEAARARANEAQGAVAEAEAALRSRQSARNSSRQQADMIRPLVANGIEPQMTLVQMENAAAVAATDAEASAATVVRSAAAVGEARAGIAQAREDWRAQAATDLAAAQADLAKQTSTMPALIDRVRRTTVTSPVAGRVNRVFPTTVGGVVRAGDPLAEVVPTDAALVIEASVTPKDIAFVRIGQEARVNISAYQSAIYGSLRGEVVSISPDAVADQKTGQSSYTVRVRSDPKGAARSGWRPLAHRTRHDR